MSHESQRPNFNSPENTTLHFLLLKYAGFALRMFQPIRQPVDLPNSSQQAGTFVPSYPEAAAKAVAPQGQQAPSLADWAWHHWPRTTREKHSAWPLNGSRITPSVRLEKPLKSLSSAYRPTHLANYTMALRAMSSHKHLRGWWLHHLPGQSTPMSNHIYQAAPYRKQSRLPGSCRCKDIFKIGVSSSKGIGLEQ